MLCSDNPKAHNLFLVLGAVLIRFCRKEVFVFMRLAFDGISVGFKVFSFEFLAEGLVKFKR